MFNKLSKDVHFSSIFDDGKTFVDALPKRPISRIYMDYEIQKKQKGFDLKSFVFNNFDFFRPPSPDNITPKNIPIKEHIERLWYILQRPADERDNGTKLPLPFPYVVPGGRFNEIYYWDSYFTLLGLAESRIDYLMQSTVNNFAYLLNTYGKIPNGNRTYYLGRSQPPFFARMVKVLMKRHGSEILTKYLPQLQQEYDFWMRDKFIMSANVTAWKRLVKTESGRILNKYHNERKGPREEMYLFDYRMAESSDRDKGDLYNNFRTACESGWVFSSRWLSDPADLTSIHIKELATIDLNALLCGLEGLLSKGYYQIGSDDLGQHFAMAKQRRKETIMQYCWNDEAGFFFDYNYKHKKMSKSWSLAGVFPLFEKLVPQHIADRVLQNIKDKFLQKGGVTTTLELTGQIWDYPFGSAPLNWVVAKAAFNYNNFTLADEVCKRFMSTVEFLYDKEHRITDKYDMINPCCLEETGQYQSQDGFGFTNGVYLAMAKLRETIGRINGVIGCRRSDC